jgi:tRNA pseudouridine55 synthase
VDGFLNLHKPAGPTSHDMVARVRHLLHVRRVGHGGTLDPMAEGVLPIGIGQATRLLSFLQEGEKAYRAEVVLGTSTTTYDAAGEVTATRTVPLLSPADLERVVALFQGEIEQVPPPFSAIRRGGLHSYQRARAGELVSLPSRWVRIVRLELLSWESPVLTIEVVCGSGTYIRSLAHDLGERLGCGAHLRSLVRLWVGPFRLAEGVTLESLAVAVQEGRAESLLLPLDLPVRHWPAVQVDEEGARALCQGRAIPVSGEDVAACARVYGPDGEFLALVRGDEEGRVLRPFRVFPQ